MPKKSPVKIKNKSKKKVPFNKTQSFKIALIIGGVFLFIIFIIFIAYFLWEKQYSNKIYPNIYINNQSVAGQTYMETLEQLDKQRDDLYESGLSFSYQDKNVVIPSTQISSVSSDISIDIFEIDTNTTVEQAYNIGRSKGGSSDFWQKIKLFFSDKKIDIEYTLNEKELKNILSTEFAEYEDPAIDAQLTFDENGSITVLDEQEGKAFAWDQIIMQVREDISSLELTNVNLELKEDYPELVKEETENFIQEVNNLLDLSPLVLKHEDKTWEMDEEVLKTWLIFSNQGVDLNIDNVTTSLQEIATELDQPVKEGKFSLDIAEDRSIQLNQFQEGENGNEIDIVATSEDIKSLWINNQKKNIDLTVQVTSPKATPDSLDNLGIKELLGTGHTSFAGSPYNRIQNIQKGADILNGLLLSPGETFSLINTLGHIDGESGWLPELVIKENKTIPEYGGGLCQIGTTSFRAAMMSGLEIVERRNHSYVVSYYNYNGKPGVDATIYEPKPDFRFKNNTDHYILWRSRIEGYDIYFELWGTSDGRKGYFTEPVNYNWRSAPEPVITYVDHLSPGQRSCSEQAHTGVSADFDYIIENSDGTQTKQTFTSVYKALPAICDEGKAEEEVAPVEEEKKEEVAPVEEETENNSNTNKKKKKKD